MMGQKFAPRLQRKNSKKAKIRIQLSYNVGEYMSGLTDGEAGQRFTCTPFEKASMPPDNGPIRESPGQL